MEPKQILKPRTVTTSREAKNHLFKAHQLMNEISLNMVAQKQRLDNERIKSQEIAKEREITETKNTHEMAMQDAKLNAVNSLI